MISSNVVLSREHLAETVDYFMQHSAFCFDVEAFGPHRGVPTQATLNWIALSTQGRTAVIPFGHPNGDRVISKATRKKNKVTGKFDIILAQFDAPPQQLRPSEVFDGLRPLFFSDRTKIAHNATYDLLSTAKYFGEVAPGPYSDTIVLQWLLDENMRSKGLKELVRKYFKHDYDTENVGKFVEGHRFSTVAHYGYLDAKYTWLLWKDFTRRIEKEGLAGVAKLEMDVLGVLLDMGVEGAPIDVDMLRQLEKELAERLVLIEADVYRAAGTKFNLNAPAQKAKLLYSSKEEGGQGLKPRKLTDGGLAKDKQGKPLTYADYSTDAESLEPHVLNPLVKAMVEYADVNKLLSTYVRGYLGDGEKRASMIFDGRVHADFVQYGTVTGRFSCVAADTLIETPRDMAKYPDGIPISEIRKGDWVYAFDHHRQLVLRRVKWVAQTGVKPTILVTLENSEGHRRSIRLTPEHLVMLRNGDWRPAGNLLKAPAELTRNPARQVMTMVRRRVEDGYIRFFPNAQAKGQGTMGGGQNREHRWIMSQVLGRPLSTKYDVDHIDGNKLNNHPSNLRYVPSLEHRGNREFAWGTTQPSTPEIYSGRLDYRPISIVPGDVEPVWDMEVEEVHNFIGNGIAVHNCREPNLQNIPRPDSELGLKIRGLFIAPSEDHRLIVADYGQIEMAFLAHFAGKGALFEGLMNGVDPHTATAAAVFKVEPVDVTKPMRQLAKAINFAVVYGAGPDKVASMADVKLAEAKKFLVTHERTFPEIYSFKKKVIATCKKRRPAHIKTLLGRKRRLPTIFANSYSERGKAERQAVNSLIQGSAADLIKLAMVRLNGSLHEDMRLILSVHDELVTICPKDKTEIGEQLVREAMLGEGIQKLVRVPLTLDVKTVDRWSAAK